MKKLIIILALFVCMHQLHSADNPHFYRATYFYGEPRLAKKGLSSWDFSLAYGQTKESRNGDGSKTCLLNLFGKQNMLTLGNGVPHKDVSDPLDLALINLGLIPAHDGFAQLLFQGEFSIIEGYITYTQNVCGGFFMQGSIPIRDIEISDIQCRDCSPTDATCPNVNTPAWQTFLTLFPQILQKYGISIAPIHKKGVGDASLLVGWTNNYQETEVLDYVDIALSGGILFPTGAQRNENLAFDVALGYNGHWGFPFFFDGSFGCYEWLTVGTHLGVIVFKDTFKNIRMKTDTTQNGFIKLAQGCANIHAGTLWEAGVYVKADHICRGISALVGYSFARKNGDSISPRATEIFNPVIACDDTMYQGWQMSTLNFLLDYDFSREQCLFGPRIGIFYNLVVGGKRVFNTSMAGGNFGLDVSLKF